MELITLKRRTGKNPREMLLELFANDEETFIIMMSNDCFNEFCKCTGVKKDHYELNPPGYNAYFINESESIASKSLLKVEVKLLENVCIMQVWNRKPAQRIYFFE